MVTTTKPAASNSLADSHENAIKLLEELSDPNTSIVRLQSIVAAFVATNPRPFVHLVRLLLKGVINPKDQTDDVVS